MVTTRSAWRLALPVVGALLSISASASVAQHGRGQLHPPASVLAQPLQLHTALVPLPAGFERPADIAGDRSGQGVYFFSEDATDARVFHWDGGNLNSWPVGDPIKSPKLVTAIQNSIAVTTHGHVWIGMNDVLLDLDTATGGVRSIDLPTPRDSAAAEAWRPAQLRGTHPVVDLAVSKNGDEVAVLRDASPDVELLTPGSGALKRVTLRGNFLPTSAVFTAKGTLGVAATSFPGGDQAQTGEVVILDAATATVTHTKSVSAAVSIATTPTGDFVTSVAKGGPPVLELDSSGASLPTTAATPNILINPSVSIVSVSATAIAEGTATGLTLFDVATGAEARVAFPTWPCSEPSIMATNKSPSALATPTHANSTCPRRAIAVTTDRTGDVWAIATGPNTLLAELSPR